MAGNGVVLKPDNKTALSPLYGITLLYEAGLVAEAARDLGRSAASADGIAAGTAMALDHRRILATAIGRLRGKMLNNHAPDSMQAQGYGCALRYLRAVAELGAARAKASGL